MPSAEPPAIGVLALQGHVAEHLRALEEAGTRPLAVRSPAALYEVTGRWFDVGQLTEFRVVVRLAPESAEMRVQQRCDSVSTPSTGYSVGSRSITLRSLSTCFA